jgi:hypothetical protein
MGTGSFDSPFAVWMQREIMNYNWAKQTINTIETTFEKQDFELFRNTKVKVLSKLNEGSKKHELAFEAENHG